MKNTDIKHVADWIYSINCGLEVDDLYLDNVMLRYNSGMVEINREVSNGYDDYDTVKPDVGTVINTIYKLEKSIADVSNESDSNDVELTDDKVDNSGDSSSYTQSFTGMSGADELSMMCDLHIPTLHKIYVIDVAGQLSYEEKMIVNLLYNGATMQQIERFHHIGLFNSYIPKKGISTDDLEGDISVIFRSFCLPHIYLDHQYDKLAIVIWDMLKKREREDSGELIVSNSERLLYNKKNVVYISGGKLSCVITKKELNRG